MRKRGKREKLEDKRKYIEEEKEKRSKREGERGRRN